MVFVSSTIVESHNQLTTLAKPAKWFKSISLSYYRGDHNLPSNFFDILKSEVIDTGLCTRCGSCAGTCPKKLVVIKNDSGDCLPELMGKCEDCDSQCYHGCPGRYVNFPALNQALYGQQPDSYLIGNYRDLWVAYSTDEKIRREGASGGVITALLKYLFDTASIEEAYVMGMDPNRPYMPKPFLARSYQEAQMACQSKYVVSPYNVMFNQIAPEGSPLAYVGLPCHVHSLRKLQQVGYAPAMRFRYVLGIYCGNIMHFSSIKEFLAKKGVYDINEVVDLAFRAGPWPGNMRVELRSGRIIEMPKFHANYLIPFHIMKRCLLCADLTNEFADISGGDAWAPVYEERGNGFSIMVVRTNLGKQLADEMIQQRKFEVVSISFDEAIAMHSHGLDFKKRGVFLRIRHRKARRLQVPEYGFTLRTKVSLSRRFMETIIGLVFRICRTSPARRLIRCVPDRVLGASFKLARKRWKIATHKTKRSGIKAVEFAVDQ